MARIAVDVTPILPGGENGGAKILTLELLKLFRELAPENEFMLLTAQRNHEELAGQEAPNMVRELVAKGDEKASPIYRHVFETRGFLRPFRRMLYRVGNSLQSYRVEKGVIRTRGIRLLFCPFSALTYVQRGVPSVAVLYDLQHRDYPEFFDMREIGHRDAYMARIRRKAEAVICISEHTRQAFIHHFGAEPSKCHSVPICVQARFQTCSKERLERDLRRLGIGHRPYMFYPANFWPHKNHAMLLTAYRMFLERNPGIGLDLVLTGALTKAEEKMKLAAAQMGLAKAVHFLGYVPEVDLGSVLQGCRFLVFPSLYEGFGIPVLEAMQFGKPIICSKSTSLPEIAGDGALYFNPRKPSEIAETIERLIKDESLEAELIDRGTKRLARFQPESMGRRYLDILRSVMGN